MNSYLCILIPSIISVFIYEHVTKKRLNTRDSIFVFLLFVLFNNVIASVVCRLLFNIVESLEIHLSSFPMFAVKYIIISLIISVILPVLYIFLEKNIIFKIEVKKKKNEEDKKHRKNK